MTEDLNSDLLTGLAAIAEFIGKPERQTQYLAERGYIPVFRLGRTIHARKSELRASLRAKAEAA